MTDIAQRISSLSPEQRALLEARLKRKGLQNPQASETIPRRKDRENPYCPPSIDQERLWFIEQLQPGNTAYNIFTASRIRGPLNAEVMERVVNEIIQRHEAFRTTLPSVDGLPVQLIAPELKLKLDPLDLQALPEEERYPEALRLTIEDFSRPFNLEKGPLVRVRLIRMAPDDHVLHVNMHHTITDRWSGAVFEKEMVLLYQAFAMGQPSPLPELPIQFADYAVWQRERMDSEAYRSELAYWKKQLEGAPFVIDFPTDFPRPPIQTFNGARVYVNYPKRLLDDLKELSRREGVTMFMTLMAAYNVLLYRYTRQEDILVSAPIGNRIRPETENIVGYLLNLLILRTDLSGNPTFRELLRREQETCIGAFAHQEVPFGKLVQELKPKQDPSRNPIAQAAFLYLDFPETTSMEFLGLTAEHIDIDNGASRFDITLSMTETSEGFIVSIEYITDLYTRERMERLAGHLQTLLEGIIANPDARISALPMLTPEEERQLTVEWNRAARDFPPEPLVPDLIAAHAAERPEATALLWEGQSISYGELDRRANQFAGRLRELGVGPEARVGILLERSPEFVAALLGTLKAGGVYLPLDTHHPAERLGFMMEDAGVSALVTRKGLHETLPQHSALILDLESDGASIERQSADSPGLKLRPEQAAYIIYTSGSTGRPKGVVIEHRQLLNTLQASHEAFGFTASDSVACLAPFSFDISLFELLSPLVNGARCLLAGSREVLDASAAARVLEEATVIQAVPSLMRKLVGVRLERKEAGRFEQLRRLLVGGESVPPELLDQMREAFPSAQVTVLYGPTEATIICACMDVERGQRLDQTMVGRPMSNSVIRILDQHGKLVPVGVDGEICIGGLSVARGYLNRHELTAERFVPDIFRGAAGERLYRTGDLGRYLPDGNIAFTGRIDSQVKVRGFRIEPGEIEAALKEHAGVRECVVVAREDTPGDRRLVAYLVEAGIGPAPGTGELRAFLKERVPEYMIPSAFLFLDQLPLTPNGKVDRKALPAPDPERPALETLFVEPESPTEEAVAAIWRQLLGINRVGLHDNYFELGGDSLLATQLASQVRKQFDIEMPLTELFQHPTLAELSALIEETIIAQMEGMSDEEAEQSLQSGF